MNQQVWNETFVEQNVRYIIESEDKVFVIENVPARVCLETGEQFFSPATVERLQATVWGTEKPKRVIETDVFEFAA